ncbi:class A beta-lactamase [Rummeliibacillus stabekisii]|uniref:class A beta-lactamase n=1 Tax=Rummeliibacillus stabekisii TaxID=241244 RepID=UPI001166F193|nr:class A beta-lactamase [Rummeliibacillus stabekisii]MBB5171316.1 beta-lactamase class A [Rummeliibacillus stabekisii]GEL05982.1 beta-lactamase [Rummeliibacillus stabekisii]
MKKLTNILCRLNKTLFLSLLGLILLAGCTNATNSSAASPEHKTTKEKGTHTEAFKKLESEFDARLGVYAIDTKTKKSISYQSDERFAFASTYKALATGAMLKQKSMKDLDKIITYTKEDLVTYSPITEKYVDTGMTVKDIATAAIRYSDNTAGNLLFNELGGPNGFEKALRKMGDKVTQSNRLEPELNLTTPGDLRDTSTPRALASNLQKFVIGDVLPTKKKALLTDLLVGNATGDTLIRAGVPKDWVVADKSGAGGYGTRNDIAVVWPPDRKPIVIAILSSRNTKDATYDDALIAKAAKVVVNALK